MGPGSAAHVAGTAAALGLAARVEVLGHAAELRELAARGREGPTRLALEEQCELAGAQEIRPGHRPGQGLESDRAPAPGRRQTLGRRSRRQRFEQGLLGRKQRVDALGHGVLGSGGLGAVDFEACPGGQQLAQHGAGLVGRTDVALFEGDGKPLFREQVQTLELQR